MKNKLHKIAKVISSIVFWILISIIVLLLFYILTIKYYKSQNRLDEVKFNLYTIITQSMRPNIEPGDIVLDYKYSDDKYKIGDVITFTSSRNNASITITHRIINISQKDGKYYYQTKGDNNNAPDTELVSSNNVIGKVIFVFPKLGYAQQFILSTTGWIVVIVLPCVGIVIYDLLKVIRISINKKKKLKKNIVNEDKNKESIDTVIDNISTNSTESIFEQ